jgi:hypothetical protein
VIRVLPLERVDNLNLKYVVEQRVNQLIYEFELEMEVKRLGT